MLAGIHRTFKVGWLAAYGLKVGLLKLQFTRTVRHHLPEPDADPHNGQHAVADSVPRRNSKEMLARLGTHEPKGSAWVRGNGLGSPIESTLTLHSKTNSPLRLRPRRSQ
jgi:hypothetical protein